MKKYKTLSIIIPVFNEEKFIEEVIKKVYKADSLGLKKEVIVVDDGSTDNTQKILKRISEKLFKDNIEIKIIKKKNEGKGSALKKGFA